MILVSGGGVFPDVELEGVFRLRVRTTENASEDMDVWVEDGKLHIAGHYGALHFETQEANRVAISVQLPR